MINKMIVTAAVAFAAIAPAQAENFSGAYIGAGATIDNFQGSGPNEGLGFSGAGATAFAGYDVPLGGAFAGVEANADLHSAKVDVLKLKWSWGVGGRLGLTVSPSTAVYGRVGYQRTQVGDGTDKAWLDGLRYGAGIETGLTEKVSLRAEFSQINYENDFITNQGALSVLMHF